VGSVHLKDHDGGYHSPNSPVGWAWWDFPAIFAVLTMAGFRGPTPSKSRAPNVDNSIRRPSAILKDCWHTSPRRRDE
jgi:hypothetical protein